MAKRIRTSYPGVFYREGKRAGTGNAIEKIYYIVFKKDGKTLEEKVGRQFQDDMTPARAVRIRAERLEGKRKSRKEIRDDKIQEESGTISKLWDAFYEAKQANKSIRNDYYLWKAHLEKDFGKKQHQELVTLDVDRLRHRLTKKGLAPATIKHAIVLLKRIINYSVQRGLCPSIDASRLHFEMPKINNIKTEDLTTEQLKALLKVLNESPNQQVANLMQMALYTGMRRGELFRLRWKDIDFKRGFITLKDPKSGVDQKIPLNQAARQVLKNHERSTSDYVFPGADDGARKDCRRATAIIKKEAGLPKDFRPLHGLRHVYASMLASSGKVDLYTLQKLMTHKSSAMTQRYAHLRDDALQRASDVAGDIFEGIRKDEKDNVVNIKKINSN
ncbi:site-specific integrase [Maridesulfovibrio ferrireducens]|uniref:tyrosine-type recombinase/integrase n=1 Tax=Maridesulfovibrio ferrireducens TaxID=246191 RepID=UPI001A23CF96|nr:site-specific integrase [Maridesulfovibrio ferrireducens]MBI9112749.1 site-specific integrase [Maridesulfovibrio ferrireducens]